MKPLQNITLYEYGRTRAWYVRVRRHGVVHAKLLSFKQWGGKQKALKLAKKLRDKLLEILDPDPRGGNQEMSRGRVYQEWRTYRDRGTGVLYEYLAWSAWIRLDNGKARHTGYSVSKHGDRKAKQMATKWLEAHRKRLKR